MKRLTNCGVLITFLALAATVPGLGAPAKKDDPSGPITAEQLKATEKKLKDILAAMFDYHDDDSNNALPMNYGAKEGKPRLSWRVAILPYLGERKLFKEFKTDEPWDSKNNKKLIERMPKVFAPVRGKADKGQTYYQMFAGKRTLLDSTGKGISLGIVSVADGTSNTFLVAEARDPVIWTKPDDILFDGETPPKLGGMFGGDFHVVLCDGTVKRIPKGFDPVVLKYAIDWNDGHSIDINAAIKQATDKK